MTPQPAQRHPSTAAGAPGGRAGERGLPGRPRVDWASAWSHLARANGWLLLLGLLSVPAGAVLRAERWRALFHPYDRSMRLGACFSAMLIGQGVNAVAPLRAGEVVRALLIGEMERVSRALALWTTVVEKVPRHRGAPPVPGLAR